MSFWKKLFVAKESPMPPTVREPHSDFRTPSISEAVEKAVAKGDLERLHALLKVIPNLGFSKDEKGMTPLHRAAAIGPKNAVNVVESLLANKAQVNAKGNEGATPLHEAAGSGNQDVVELLLANGADVHAKTNAGPTPLHEAAGGGRKYVVEVLLANKAAVNAKDKDGKKPSDLAAGMGYRNVVELLRWHDHSDSGANLERWRASEEPERWVRAHQKGWNHQDWLDLLASLRRSQYWPMDEAAIGQHLEMLRATLPPLSPATTQVTFQGEERQIGAHGEKIIWKLYSAPSREAAVGFLRNQTVTEPFFYIQVDTPSGRFGIDIAGRIYDSFGRFIDAEPEPEKMAYDAETLKMKSALESAMRNEQRQAPRKIIAMGESSLGCLHVIIEDASADFSLRRMAVWWGGPIQ